MLKKANKKDYFKKNGPSNGQNENIFLILKTPEKSVVEKEK